MKIDKFHRMGRGKPSPQEAPPLKMNISDMMDHVESIPIQMEEGENVPIQGIQRAVRAKIREQAARPAAGGRLARAWPAAAAAALLCATAAAAVIQWNGFAFTQGMSREERSALVAQGDVLYFLTAGGLCCFNGVNAGLLSDARRIHKTLAAMDASNCRGALARNKLYFTLSGPEEDMLVEYDLFRRAYMFRRGFSIGDIAAWDGRLYMVNDARYLYRFDEGDTYDGADIEAWWNTPLTDLYDKGGVKAMRSLCLRGQSQQDAALLAEVCIDGVTTTHRLLLPQHPWEVLEVPLCNEGRTFRLAFSNEAGGRFTLTGGVELAFETWRRVE